MFGYVYMWYLMAVLVFEIWLDYRREIVLLSIEQRPAAPCLQGNDARSSNISERSLPSTSGWAGSTLVGIPSAFLLHGYAGSSSASLKANPCGRRADAGVSSSRRWCRVSPRDAALYGADQAAQAKIDMHCVDTIAMYMFISSFIDFSLEMLDLIHRIYEPTSLSQPEFHGTHQALFSQIVLQICLARSCR